MSSRWLGESKRLFQQNQSHIKEVSRVSRVKKTENRQIRITLSQFKAETQQWRTTILIGPHCPPCSAPPPPSPRTSPSRWLTRRSRWWPSLRRTRWSSPCTATISRIFSMGQESVSRRVREALLSSRRQQKKLLKTFWAFCTRRRLISMQRIWKSFMRFSTLLRCTR